ncbi:MAG: hypothetical protein P4L93_03400 [Coriobacteriia bacterium]|nr:hypothetical protein [Coriobacteriia bacterium]
MKRIFIILALVAIALFTGVVTYATADTAIINGVGGASQTASDTVTVKATINPKLTLTVVTPAASQTVDFGTLDPGTVSAAQNVNLTVQSNKTYNITKTTTGAAPIGLATSLANSTNNARTAGQLYADSYQLTVPWTTDPGSYTATVQYTVIQN